MKMYTMPDPQRTLGLSTQEARAIFLMEDLFKAGEIQLAYCDVDRTIVGSAVPKGGTLTLGTADELRADLVSRREQEEVEEDVLDGRWDLDVELPDDDAGEQRPYDVA